MEMTQEGQRLIDLAMGLTWETGMPSADNLYRYFMDHKDNPSAVITYDPTRQVYILANDETLTPAVISDLKLFTAYLRMNADTVEVDALSVSAITDHLYGKTRASSIKTVPLESPCNAGG
jgi:hypothetical protein